MRRILTPLNKNYWAWIRSFALLLVCVSPGYLSATENAPQTDIEKSVEKAVEKTLEKAADKAVEKAVEKAFEKAAEKAVEGSVDKAAEKVVEKTLEKAADKAVEKSVEMAAEKAVEKAAEAETARSELKAKRPDEWRGPTNVHFLIFVIDIDNIDDANQNFTANVYLRLRWKDRRLASPGGAVRQMRLEDVWNPRVLLANRTGLISKSLPDIVQVHPDGTVIYYQRYTGKLSQPLRLSEFPKDKHSFVIQFVAAGYSADELKMLPDVSPMNPDVIGGTMATDLSLTDWKVIHHEALSLPYEPIEGVSAAGFGLRFEAERYVEYYIWQVVLPLAVVVMMSWAAFWIGRVHIGVRIGVATSSILTLIAHRFVLASLLPRLPYMTRLDYFTVGSTLLVFMALLTVVITSYLATINRDIHARRVDHVARAAFPITFFLLLAWFLR